MRLVSALAVAAVVHVSGPTAAAPPDPHPLERIARDILEWRFGGGGTVLPPAALADSAPNAGAPAGTGQDVGALAFGGGRASGVVIAPPAHPDARPWPDGMVMAPPDARDPMAIAPGADGLPAPGPRVPAPGWSRQLADVALGGVGALLGAMLPSGS